LRVLHILNAKGDRNFLTLLSLLTWCSVACFLCQACGICNWEDAAEETGLRCVMSWLFGLSKWTFLLLDQPLVVIHEETIILRLLGRSIANFFLVAELELFIE